MEGDIQFQDTGDDLIDRWEEQIARGETPDLTEAFSKESLEYNEKKRIKAQGQDPYAGMSMKDMFDSVSETAASQGLTVGKHGTMPKQHAILEDLKSIPTFGFTEDCDD